MNLRIPGPTPLPPHVMDAVGRQMINHRGPEFETLLAEITAWSRPFFETEHDVLLLTCSGTGGLEAAIVNSLSPGDRVLSVSIGTFGERFARIASAFGADVQTDSYAMGEPADPDRVRGILEKDGPFSAVLVTQNETSTGVTNDMAALCAAIEEVDPRPLILVDGISGIPAIRLQTDVWGCDVVITGTQKAWMAPPGGVLLTVSPRAWQAHETARMPRFYLDLTQAKRYAQRHQTPATPSIPAVFGLHASLREMVKEGREAFQLRHERIGALARHRAADMGLELFARPGYESNTVSAVKLGDGVASSAVIATLREEHGVVVASSKAPGVEMIRIGHMGYVSECEIHEVFDALAQILGR